LTRAPSPRCGSGRAETSCQRKSHGSLGPLHQRPQVVSSERLEHVDGSRSGGIPLVRARAPQCSFFAVGVVRSHRSGGGRRTAFLGAHDLEERARPGTEGGAEAAEVAARPEAADDGEGVPNHVLACDHAAHAGETSQRRKADQRTRGAVNVHLLHPGRGVPMRVIGRPKRATLPGLPDHLGHPGAPPQTASLGVMARGAAVTLDQDRSARARVACAHRAPSDGFPRASGSGSVDMDTDRAIGIGGGRQLAPPRPLGRLPNPR